jgi:hypothetical protein
MAAYVITGASGAASSTAATAGIVMVDNPSSAPIARPKIVNWSVGPGAAASDDVYSVQLKRQTTRGTWTSVTPALLDCGTAISTGGRASTAAGSASTVLGIWGFSQRAGYRVVYEPGCEPMVNPAVSNGIILEYLFVVGTLVNYGTLTFVE